MTEHRMQIVNGIRCRPEDTEAVRNRLTAAGHAIVEPAAPKKRRRPAGKTPDGTTPPPIAPGTGDGPDDGDGDDGQDDGTGDGSAES